MIDLHSHILPGIDDGAKNMEQSLEMAKVAVNEGITTLFATPHHHHNGRYINIRESIFERVAELNERLSHYNIPLLVLPGQEPRIYGELLDDYDNGKIVTVNDKGKYLLIELPSSQVPYFTEQLLFDIQLRGLTPIIVHPERNSRLIEEPNLLYQFVKKGALTQLTASSITGEFGKKIKKFSMQLLDANLAHVIASDAHNTGSRGFHMQKAFHHIHKQFGQDMGYMLRENAQLITEGRMVYKEPPATVTRRKILGVF
ncbi:tyrosine-protein phosphatase [Priestia koreensis]|uniref:tyrosine-protein phosphatase n=1 Tax=Priestia koreensis TaxID=284581 RepID=UPI0030189270